MADDPRSTVSVDADTSKAQREIKTLSESFGGFFGDVKAGASLGLGAFSNFFSGIGKASGDLKAGFAGLLDSSSSIGDRFRMLGMGASDAFGKIKGETGRLGSELGALGGMLGEGTGLTGLFGKLGGVAPLAAGAAVGGIVLLASAVGGAVFGLGALVKSAADAGDRMFTMSRQFGISVEALSTFQYIGQQTGVTLESIANSSFKLGINVQKGGKDASAAFKAIGTSAQELKALKPEEQFTKVIEGLAKIPDEGQRAAAGFAIFGKQFKDISQLTSEDLKELSENARNLGVVMSDEFAAAGDQFGDTLADIGGLLNGLKISIGAALLPVVNAFLGTIRDELVAAFGILKTAFGPIFAGFSGMTKSLTETGQSAEFHALVLKSLVGVIAFLTDAFAAFVRAAAFVVSVYYDIRIAANLLLITFGKVVEGVIWASQQIPAALAKVSFGETRRQFERDAAEIGRTLDVVRKDIQGLGNDNAALAEKQKSLSTTMTGFADKLNVASASLRVQAAAYKGVKTEVEAVKKPVHSLGDDFEFAADKAKESKEKISDFAKTSSAQIAELWKEWQKQPPAIRANSESVDILIDKYLALRSKVTDKSKLPAELEMIAIFSGRLIPIVNGLGKEFEELGKRIPHKEIKGVSDLIFTLPNIVVRAADGMENLGTRIPVGKLKEFVDIGAQMMGVIDKISGAFATLGQITGGGKDSVIGKIGEMVGLLKVSATAGEQIATGWDQIGKGGKNAAIGAASMASGLIGAYGAMQQATSSGSKTLNVINGMSQGAAIGTSIMPGWGTAVGAAVGAIWGAIKKVPDWKTLQKDIQTNFGFAVSEGLAKAMEDAAKRIEGGTKAQRLQIGQALNLSKIIEEAGGINPSTLDRYVGMANLLLERVEKGGSDASEAFTEFNRVFAQFGDHLATSGAIADKTFLQLIARARATGEEFAGLTAFVQGQVKNIVGGIAAFVDNAVVTTQETATALGAAVAAVFAEVQRNGGSVAEALAAVGPLITKLQAEFEAAGLSGGQAFDDIRNLALIAGTEISTKALGAVSGLTQALVGLHNTGLLTDDMFRGLTSQIVTTRDALISQGASGSDALRLMQGDLQKVWELTRLHGYAVDETTEELLKEAEASGVVGEKYLSAAEKQLLATERMTAAIEFMAKKMGYIPVAADQMADGIDKASGRARKSIDGIGTSAETAGKAVKRIASEGLEDIEALRTAVDGVALGSSPGGLKEWKIKALEAMTAFRDLKAIASPVLDTIRAKVDAVGAVNPGFVGPNGQPTDQYGFPVQPASGVGDVYVLVQNDGTSRKLTRSEYLQIEQEMVAGGIRIPNRMVQGQVT